MCLYYGQKNSKLKFKGVDGEPQPKYRDRAAERRTLHRGFGIGPGQKLVSVHELEKEEAEAATEMPAALEKAASARRIGRDNIGKRMLEGMGWKEVSCFCSTDQLVQLYRPLKSGEVFVIRKYIYFYHAPLFTHIFFPPSSFLGVLHILDAALLQGQSLGSGEGGLVDPILALGNTGRTGLGWN